MLITYDPAKRDRTLREGGLDFERSKEVFAGLTIDIPDLRRDYGEPATRISPAASGTGAANHFRTVRADGRSRKIPNAQ